MPESTHGWSDLEVTEARAMIRRMLEDWPYQPPEVIEPERRAIKAWLDEHRLPFSTYVAALQAGVEGVEL